MSSSTLPNMNFITSMLTVDDPCCSSHGAENGAEYLSAGLLYYSLAYSTRAHTCVDGAQLDWDLTRTLVAGNGVITQHDTTNCRESCGVPQLADEIRESGEYDVVNFPIACGTAIAKKILTMDQNINASRAGRTSAPGKMKQA